MSHAEASIRRHLSTSKDILQSASVGANWGREGFRRKKRPSILGFSLRGGKPLMRSFEEEEVSGREEN